MLALWPDYLSIPVRGQPLRMVDLDYRRSDRKDNHAPLSFLYFWNAQPSRTRPFAALPATDHEHCSSIPFLYVSCSYHIHLRDQRPESRTRYDRATGDLAPIPPPRREPSRPVRPLPPVHRPVFWSSAAYNFFMPSKIFSFPISTRIRHPDSLALKICVGS
jgi:hypothetical protein